MAKKKVVGGVDLNSLTDDQKLELHEALSANIEDLQEKKRNKRILELSENGTWQKYNDELKQIIKEAKELTKTQTLEVNVPVKFTFKMQSSVVDSTDILGMWYGLLSYDYNNDVSDRVGQVEGLSKKQQDLLQRGIEDVVAGACGDILDLLPKEFHQKYESITKRINALRAKLEKDDLELVAV